MTYSVVCTREDKSFDLLPSGGFLDARRRWLRITQLADAQGSTEFVSVAIHRDSKELEGWVWRPRTFFRVPDGWRPDMSPREMLPEEQA